MILAGDIGGTNTRLAYFEEHEGRLKSAVLDVFPSREFKGLEEIVAKFRAAHNAPVEHAAFGVAGPVQGCICATPNLAWIVDGSRLAHDLGLTDVHLLNDLEANAHGIGELGPADFLVLNEGDPNATGNAVLISPGTGLGEAGLILEDGRYRPFPSEGGHADFAPCNELQIELLRYLLAKFDHVSYERVLSGPGLYNIYQFLRDTGRSDESPQIAEQMRTMDPPAVITKAALAGDSALCVAAMDLFVSIFGAEAGNLALKVVSSGGVFLGGGMPPRIVSKLREPAFLEAFRAKGRMSKLLAGIPVRVILNDKTALLGAGRVAADQRNAAC
jgi:glucokinase